MQRLRVRVSALSSLLLVLSAFASVLPVRVLDAQQAEKNTARKSTGKGATSKRSASKRSAGKRTTAKPKAAAARSGGDTTRKRTSAGTLGRVAGDRHLAFRGMGSDLDSLWPPKMPAPLPGSILPARRIIAFYGNPLSRRMGILGEFDPPEMLRKLDAEVAEWNRLDPEHPVQPALHLISVVAQGAAGSDGKYRARMDSAMVEKVYGWARSRNAILFLDVQVGLSTLQAELPLLERFLKRPDVHLGIDPEFSMKNGGKPGKRIGTYDASDINYASRFLAGLVDKYQLPPKLLIVHRFTQKGVTNARDIRLDPKVQVVMHMDGFGAPWLKRDSFYAYVKREPVQFAGWKQFTKSRNDSPPTSKPEILRLWPVPLYIQYQ
ncbi:MAG: hypothetical protein IT359_15085 [Gemmatimonadaceae bacterium]|nr:hypothetical protein [Gemmatimonadaceae bacterium]